MFKRILAVCVIFLVFGLFSYSQRTHAQTNKSENSLSSSVQTTNSTDSDVAKKKVSKLSGLTGVGENNDFENSGPSITKMAKGLGYCLAVLFILLYFFKRFGGGSKLNQKRRVKVLERCPISSRTAVLLVNIDGSDMLLSVGAEQVTVLRDSFGESKACLNFDEVVRDQDKTEVIKA